MSTLYVVGIANGDHDNLTIKADKILNDCEYIYCDSKAYEKLLKFYPKHKLISNEYKSTHNRCLMAIEKTKEGFDVAIVGSGDTGIYGISSIVLENANMNEMDVKIIPGITFALSGAALLGAPLQQDFIVITLSDNLMDKKNFLNKLKMAAMCDLNIVFYSPHNPTCDNLKVALKVLKELKDEESTIVGITTNIDSLNQKIEITNLKKFDLTNINEFSTIFICNSTSKLKQNKIITPLTR